jgi:SNF2 family DNA or RNA helicase
MSVTFNPHDYQMWALRWLIKKTITGDSSGAALFLDTGLGKSAVTLAWLRLLKSLKLHKAALVVAPLRVVYSVWPREIEKWAQFSGLRVVIVHGTATQRLAALATPADIYLVNPEGVPWLRTVMEKRDLPFDTLVIDESSKFKTWGSIRTKALRKLLPRFSRRLILTGTPSANGLQDLFAQVFIADRGASLGTGISKFRNRYFYRGGYSGYKYMPIENADKLIYQKIGDVCLRMSAEEFLDLPELLENDVWVDLPPKAAKQYRQLEKEMFLALEEDAGELTPANAGARYNACRQVCNGGVYDAEDKSIVHQIHGAKIEAVRDLVDELQGKPVLLAFQYRHDLARLREVWPRLPSIDGTTKAQQADQLIQDWNDGKLPLLAVQPQSLSHGVNMQAGPGRDVIWIGLNDNLEIYLQLNARLHRQGVTGQVRIHRVMARGTVDEAVLDRIQRKEAGQTALLDALERYRD